MVYTYTNQNQSWKMRRKNLCDFELQTDHLIPVRKPDLLIVNKKKRESTEIWTSLSQPTTE